MKMSGSDGSHWITSILDVIHFFEPISKGFRRNAAQFTEIRKRWITWISTSTKILYRTSRKGKSLDQVIHVIQVIQNIPPLLPRIVVEPPGPENPTNSTTPTAAANRNHESGIIGGETA